MKLPFLLDTNSQQNIVKMFEVNSYGDVWNGACCLRLPYTFKYSVIWLFFSILQEVNEAWSGLGYYSRGRRLFEGAKKVYSYVYLHWITTVHMLYYLV